jgi:DNA-binding response OmpR family regulator
VGRTVILIDEDVNARIIAETLLRIREIDVRVAADGTEAYEIVRRRGAGVVVVDLGTPGTNGLEVIRTLCGRFAVLPLPAQPRIVAVSHADNQDLERFARRLGADVVMHKPLKPAQFVSTVEGLLDSPDVAAAAAS